MLYLLLIIYTPLKRAGQTTGSFTFFICFHLYLCIHSPFCSCTKGCFWQRELIKQLHKSILYHSSGQNQYNICHNSHQWMNESLWDKKCSPISKSIPAPNIRWMEDILPVHIYRPGYLSETDWQSAYKSVNPILPFYDFVFFAPGSDAVQNILYW